MRGENNPENNSVEKLSRGNMLNRVKEYQTARSGARTEKKLRKASPK